jgi:signal transduction histidine kinase
VSHIRRALGGTRTRILAAFVVLMAFSTVVSVIAIYEVLTVRADDRLDAALDQEIDEFRRLAAGDDPDNARPFGENVERIFEVYKSRNVPGRGEVVELFANGAHFDTVSSPVGGVFELKPQYADWARLTETTRGEIETPTETVRYLAVPVKLSRDRPRGVFVVAASLSAERDDVTEAVQLATLVLISVLLIASALAWAVAGRILAPLRTLDETARSISETDLTRRIPVSGNDEIAELARTFNAMVERLDRAFASQRAFVSDASHELRTPITIVRGHLELLGDDPEERRETIALVTDELDRMSRFVNDLLLLAKAERQDFLRIEEVELGALTDELLEKATGLGPRTWALEGRAEARIQADRQRLTQAIMGLAQNAVQHTSDGDAVWIGTGVDDGEVSLWVRDSGPGIPREDQARVFERFARAAASRRRSEGAGLGLAIVRAIAEAHGGRAELASMPGAGSTFTVVVPLDGPEMTR